MMMGYNMTAGCWIFEIRHAILLTFKKGLM